MQLKDLSNEIGFYIAVVVMPIGALLNAFSIYIFTRPDLQKTNMGFLFIWQKSIDTLLLLSYTFIFRAPLLFDIDWHDQSDAACKLLSFYQPYILSMSSCFIVFIGFDRFMFVHYHGRFKFMKRKRNLLTIIALLALTLAIVHATNFWFYLDKKQEYSNNSTITTIITSSGLDEEVASHNDCKSTKLVHILSDLASILVRVHVPLVLLSAFNLNLIYDLYKSKNRIRLRMHRKEIQFTFTVIFANLMFFIHYLPFSIFILLKHIIEHVGIDYSKEIFDFLYHLATECALLYLIFEFFYLLLVNKLFRHEVLNVLKWTRSTLSVSGTLTSMSLSQNQIYGPIRI